MPRPLLPYVPVLGCLLLAACAQQQSAQGADGAAGSCDARAAQFAVGYASTDALAAEVRRRSGARVVRVIHPGEMVTQEFSADRVNIELEAGNGVSERARMGQWIGRLSIYLYIFGALAAQFAGNYLIHVRPKRS